MDDDEVGTSKDQQEQASLRLGVGHENEHIEM